MKELLNLSSYFLKKAGLLKVPEKTLQEVENWALSCYFRTARDYIFLPKLKELGPPNQNINKSKDIFDHKFSGSDMIRKELEDILLECERFISKRISSNTTFYLASPISNKLYSFGGVFLFEDSLLRKGFWDDEEIKYQDDIENDDIFRLGYLTLWFGFDNIIYPRDAENIEKKANEIVMTVRHELQHVIQTIIKLEFKQRDDKGQLIREIKNTKFDLAKSKITNNQLVHAHRDIEFYTDLTDSINTFKAQLVQLPKIIHKFYFEYWIAKIDINEFYKKIENIEIKFGKRKEKLTSKKFSDIFSSQKTLLQDNNEMFWSWRIHEPEKYKKAVKEFYKEVQDLL